VKDVKATTLPRCDVCKKPGCGVYNTPTKQFGPCGGKWANMCGPCFDDYGLDTSVTERRVLPKSNDPAGGWGARNGAIVQTGR
jgi:hypothetical protein